MGRVEEALRRAAAAETAVAVTRTPEAEPAFAGTAGPDAFPAEAIVAPDAPAESVLFSPNPATPTLAERIAPAYSEKLVVNEAMPSASREQYRRLAAVLHAGQQTAGLKVIMVASAVPAEGKTLTASNLALTFSESYQRRVLLIDADLRRPSLDRLFGIPSAAGLSEGLSTEGEARLPVQQVSDRLSVLPAGQANTDPMAGLTSERMRRLLEEARGLFDWVIIDTPPIVLLPDAHLLASMVDGAVLVIRAASTPHDLVRRAIDAIHRDRVLGVVLNSAQSEHQEGYGSYDSYYKYYESSNGAA